MPRKEQVVLVRCGRCGEEHRPVWASSGSNILRKGKHQHVLMFDCFTPQLDWSTPRNFAPEGPVEPEPLLNDE